MAEGGSGGHRQVPAKYDLDAKYDACLDLSLRRVLYSSLAGAFGGLLLFRSPVTRWASVAMGAGVGIGSAYTECSYIFDGSPPKFSDVKESFPPPPPPSQYNGRANCITDDASRRTRPEAFVMMTYAFVVLICKFMHIYT